MSDCCQDCHHYVHFMDFSRSSGQNSQKGDVWRIGVEWTNLEEGRLDVNCGVLFRHEKKLFSQKPLIGAIELGPYAQAPTGYEAEGNLLSHQSAVPPQKSACAIAIQMKEINEAQFYVVIDDAPVEEYEAELKVVLERGGEFAISTVKVIPRLPVIALHYITRSFDSRGTVTETIYDPAKVDRFATRRELSRSASSWYDFDWEAQRHQPA